MLSRELGFMTSWKMLTRDKGWIKPVLVLTLVSWIPILGTIAILGYGLEWARLTAWGVDAAPKQRGVNYGKLLSTGGIAFLVSLTMGAVLGIFDLLLFGDVYVAAALPMGMSALFLDNLLNFTGMGFALGGASVVLMLLMLVVNLFMGTFITAAMMRSTLYDSFAAGWRVDRLFQMIGRDAGGFFHTYAVSLIGGIVSWVAGAVISLVGGLVALGGLFGAVVGASNYSYDVGAAIMHMGALPVLIFVVLAIVAFFAIDALGVAMQLVALNAVGQWFCRFDVSRWGVSSAPLPNDVPRVTPPVYPAAMPATPVSPQDYQNGDQGTYQHVGEPVVVPAPEPRTVPQPELAQEPVVQPAEVPGDSIPMPPVSDPVPFEEPSSQVGEAGPVEEPIAEKKPIPLGPVCSSDAEKPDEEVKA